MTSCNLVSVRNPSLVLAFCALSTPIAGMYYSPSMMSGVQSKGRFVSTTSAIRQPAQLVNFRNFLHRKFRSFAMFLPIFFGTMNMIQLNLQHVLKNQREKSARWRWCGYSGIMDEKRTALSL
jgi:hypothetical protein